MCYTVGDIPVEYRNDYISNDNSNILIMTPEENKLEEALTILIAQLEDSSVRKFTCINGFGFSQLERDIVDSQKDYWQKGMYTEDEVIMILREFGNHIIKKYNPMHPVIGEVKGWFERNKKKEE